MPNQYDLPTNIDATYPDDPAHPGRKAHQQAHDKVHAIIAQIAGVDAPLGSEVLAKLGAVFATNAQLGAAVTNLINGAPGALNTLEKIADALGDDPSLAATLNAALAVLTARDSLLEFDPSPTIFTFTENDRASNDAWYGNGSLVHTWTFVATDAGPFRLRPVDITTATWATPTDDFRPGIDVLLWHGDPQPIHAAPSDSSTYTYTGEAWVGADPNRHISIYGPRFDPGPVVAGFDSPLVPGDHYSITIVQWFTDTPPLFSVDVRPVLAFIAKATGQTPFAENRPLGFGTRLHEIEPSALWAQQYGVGAPVIGTTAFFGVSGQVVPTIGNGEGVITLAFPPSAPPWPFVCDQNGYVKVMATCIVSITTQIEWVDNEHQVGNRFSQLNAGQLPPATDTVAASQVDLITQGTNQSQTVVGMMRAGESITWVVAQNSGIDITADIADLTIQVIGLVPV